MIEHIEGMTANEVWKKAANKILQQNHITQGRTGETFELLHTIISIENPRQKWIYDRVPPISIGFALAELVWIMNGEDYSGIINYWNPSLTKYAGKEGHYHGAYGKRIRSHFGFDQLEKAYDVFLSNPESRQVVIQIYDTKSDFPLDKGLPRNSDIPCNVCSLLKIRKGKLEWSQIMRSNDLLLGMPYNFVQFTSMQEILAGWLGLKIGAYVHYSDSLHLYCRDIDKIRINHLPEEENMDSLALNKKMSEKILGEIYKRMKKLTDSKITERDILILAQLDSEYMAYNNIMWVIAAYAAKKHCNEKLADELIKNCSNGTYTAMWNRWKCKENKSN